MIDHLGLGRMVVLLVGALVVFGPDRLPDIAAQLGRGLRQFRGVLDTMSSEVKTSMGPELADLDLKSLHPKALVRDLMQDPPAPIPSYETASSTPGSPPAGDRPSDADAMTLLHSTEDVGGDIPLEWRTDVSEPASR